VSETASAQAGILRLLVEARPSPDDPEFREYSKYESGDADKDALAVAGPHAEPWLNVLAHHEPGTRPTLDAILADPELGPRVRGRVLDLAAGTCWASATLSRLPRVSEVVALDLSPRFLTTVGPRMIRALEGCPEKIAFAACSFERVLFPADHFDVVLVSAAIHHALAPLKVLLEARRVLRNGGLLILIENPTSIIGLARARRSAIATTRESGATEIAYTRGELAYLLAHAGFEDASFTPHGALSRNPLKRWLRLVLRTIGVEHVLVSVNYAITATKRSGSPSGPSSRGDVGDPAKGETGSVG
jgi:SAM-dependent methyltransferase